MRNVAKYLILLLFASSLFAAPVRQPHLEAELVSSHSAVIPGEGFYVALRLKPDPGWHTYWEYPGDSGEPPSIKWDLPEGLTANPIVWPVPKRISVPPLVNFGYEREILLPVPISGSLPSEKSVIRAKARWLVCKEECVPGEAKLSVVVRAASSGPVKTKWYEQIHQEIDRAPSESLDGLSATRSGDRISLSGLAFTAVTFFPKQGFQIENAADQPFQAGTLTVSQHSQGQLGTLSGVLVTEKDGVEKGYNIDVPIEETTSFASILFFAFLGGMLLNLMPCVFPVLSIKVLHFVHQANEDRTKTMIHSALYALGILVSFWALAGALIALRSGGEALGWGFQLQTPWFVGFLFFLMLAMGLNFLGLFEVPGISVSGGSEKSPYFNAFSTGILATLVATPCTAPFMGAALGYALAQPPVNALAVFTALGLGMALPYQLLASFPPLLRWMPKPGAWMVTFKKILGFPLLATAAWLASVFAQQTNPTALMGILIAAVVLSSGLWVWGEGFRFSRSVGTVLCLVALSGGWWVSQPQDASAEALDWTPFTEARLTELENEGGPIFINFTAAWCITCQVNERVIFTRDDVRDKFAEKNVTLVKADWTEPNEEIASRLEKYERNGIPVYVLYPGGGKEPKILPEVITPDYLLAQLDEL